MKNGKFTEKEQEYLSSLDAVLRVNATTIYYADDFKKKFIEEYKLGESPIKIFEAAGLKKEIIGYKRIERACARWRAVYAEGSLTGKQAVYVRHNKHIETLKREKRIAVQRQRDIRKRQIQKMEEKLAKQKRKSKSREEKIIASQRAEIERLKSQVKALKANGTLAKKSRRAPGTTYKSERFEVILQLKRKDDSLVIGAACKALGVSKSGYYEYVKAEEKRRERIEQDKKDEEKILRAYRAHNAKKGSRLIVDTLWREQGIVMSRKKVQRLMRLLGISGYVHRRRPYRNMSKDGTPKIVENIINRQFKTGRALEVLSTDITYLPCSDYGFVYMSAVIDCETKRLLAHACSTSLKEQFVLDTHDQLKKYKLSPNVVEQSDQGIHYTSITYRNKLKELGIKQSMSKKGCCHDNAPIESFWGRMKEQIGNTKHLSAKEVTELVENYVDYYNNFRGQERLGWKTPVEYERDLLVG